MGLFAQAGDPFQPSTWTVSELTAYIRELFAIDYRLQDLEVSGEISNFTQARSGHFYFTLKDAGAQIKCVMWRSAAERLLFQPREGDAVVADGRISIYEAGGVYQLYVEHMQPAGRGSLAVAFEQLKQRLGDEGLFDPAHKKPIPPTPRKIGIVTSADAAALRDILNVLNRRYPLAAVLIAPTLVQGADAPAQIVRALQWLDGRTDIDTIILARGGGSIEDLWGFNDERVARTIFAAQHPIITGVGHETDFTIADFVADRRAPTPSAAAELATPDIEEIRPLLQALQTLLRSELDDLIRQKRWRVQTLVRALAHLSPQARLENNQQRLDVTVARLDRAMGNRLARQRGRLAVLQAGLTAVSPLATLSRGYAIVRRADGRIIRAVADAAPGDALMIQVSDGQIDAQVKAS
ncbi:MAG: exodeoxyribonuclease VII large subunit [Chloroflexi bacterium]|nr:exodeoxyribonuclease VII large subunit [Chloroflexota bacterium]